MNELNEMGDPTTLDVFEQLHNYSRQSIFMHIGLSKPQVDTLNAMADGTVWLAEHGGLHKAEHKIDTRTAKALHRKGLICRHTDGFMVLPDGEVAVSFANRCLKILGSSWLATVEIIGAEQMGG